jgi:putative membrane protein
VTTTNDSRETKSSNELAVARTDLAVSRNLMAADRTLMAWVRTAMSMYSFGFTIYKILDAFQKSGGNLPRAQTPRNIGLFLSAMGTFSMALGVIEYWQALKEMHPLKVIPLVRSSLVMGLLMSGMGLLLFVGIITHLV